VATRTPTHLIPPDLPVDAAQVRVSPLLWVPHLGAAVAAVKGAGAVAVVRLVAVAMDVPLPPPPPPPPPPSLAGGAGGGKRRRGGRRAYGLWVERLVAGRGGRVAGAVVAPEGGGGGGGSGGGDGRGRWRARDAVLRVLTADGQLGCFLLEREDWGGLADDSRLALV